MQTQSCSVYRATSPSGKRYYGISQEIEKRWWRHERDAKKGANRPFAKAVSKYGFDAMNFEIVITEIGDACVEKCKDAEMMLIEMDNTMVPNGYNVTAGGDGTVGWKQSPQTIQRRKATTKDRGWTPTKHSIEAAIAANKVRVMPESEILARQAHMRNISFGLNGGTHSDESKAKMSAAKLGKPLTDNHKQSLKIARQGVRDVKARYVECVETGKVFDTLHAAARHCAEHGYPKATASKICLACKGQRKSAYGYTWKYV